MNTTMAICHFAHPRLAFKEFRQLLPLLCILPFLAFLSWILQSVLPFLMNVEGPKFMDLTYQLPAIFFAVGVGGLLVSDEKERQTLGWLLIFPVSPQEILRSKLVVALGGLGLVWLLGFLAALLFRPFVPVSFSGLEWVSAITLSLFVLLASIAIAWHMDDFLKSVLILLAFAYVPTLLGNIAGALFVSQSTAMRAAAQTDQMLSYWVVVFQTLFCVPAAYLAWRGGIRHLSATKLPPTSKMTLALQLRPPLVDTSRWRTASLAMALSWQHARQNSILWLGLVVLYLVSLGLILNVMGRPAGSIAAQASVGYLLAVLATGWLGMSTFHSDYWGNRIQFLADRGVSPGLIWQTRQHGPLLILVVFCAPILASLLATFGTNVHRSVELLPVMGSILVGLLWVYAIGQWLGQSIKSSVLTASLLPFMSLIVLFYFWFSVLMLETPWWLMLLIAVLIMAFTWFQAKAGLQLGRTRRFWIPQLGLILAILVLPWLSLLWLHWSLPQMNPATRAEIRAFAATIPKISNDQQIFTISLLAPPQTQHIMHNQAAPASPMSLFDLDLIEANATDAIGNLEIQQGELRGLADEWTFAFSLANLLVTKATQENDSQAKRLYNKIVLLHQSLISYFRANPHDYMHHYTDEIEIWLLRQLLDENSAALIEDEVYNRVVEVLHDQEARRHARRQAVVIQHYGLRNMQRGLINLDSTLYHFRRFYRSITDPSFSSGELSYSERVKQIARQEEVLEHLWHLSAERSEASPERLAKLAAAWNVQPALVGQGPDGKYYRTDDARQFFRTNDRPPHLGTQWAAGWEKQAAELKPRLQTK